MKLTLALVWAFAADAAKVLQRADDSCPGNKFPQPGQERVLQGKSQWATVVDQETFLASVAGAGWATNTAWELSVTATSTCDHSTEFGFEGGGGGFLVISVPKGVVDRRLTAKGAVQQEDNTTFVYRSADPLSDCQVKLSGFCLTPALCDDYNCTSPEFWKHTAQTGTPGHTNAQCCSERNCNEEVPDCASAGIPGEWKNKPQAQANIPGSTPTHCCLPNRCTDSDLCTGSKLKNKAGSGIRGNTAAQCCDPRRCNDFSCSDAEVFAKIPGDHDGSSDDECCEQRKCSTSGVTCEPANMWKKLDGFDNILGYTPAACCDAVLCDEFECSEETKYEHKGKGVQGNNQTMCCAPKTCQTHDCNSTKMERFPHNAAAPRLGSTDEECCQVKLCKDQTHVCLPSTKWVHKANHDPTKLLIRGIDDAACCNMLMCSSFACDGLSWKAKNATELDGLQGSTPEECCDPVWCEEWVCASANATTGADSTGTQWYKKADTNAFKWQGASDEECCLPIYCSQYVTQFPSKWRRKQDKSALGSTDPECYDPIMCANHCPNDNYRCMAAGLVIREDAVNISGSTDEECCMSPTTEPAAA